MFVGGFSVRAGVRRYISGACKIERRPRGASQHKAAPTSVSGQLFLRQRRAAPWCATGIPIDDASEQVSILLSYIKHLLREGDMEDDHKFLGAADYLTALAKALMNEVELTKNTLR